MISQLRNPLSLLKIWLLIAFFVIPLLSTSSYQLGAVVAVSLVINALVAVILVWFVFMIFPYSKSELSVKAREQDLEISPAVRFKKAVITIIIVFHRQVVITLWAIQRSIRDIEQAKVSNVSVVVVFIRSVGPTA